MKCLHCGHRLAIHHIIEDNRKVCDGECFPCECNVQHYETIEKPEEVSNPILENTLRTIK